MKKLSLFFLMTLFCVTSFAQDDDAEKELKWYLGFDAGAQIFTGMSDHNMQFGDRIAPAGEIRFGRRITHWLDIDANFGAAQFKGLYVRPVGDKHFATETAYNVDSKLFMQSGAYMHLYLRAGFDLNTIFAGYDPDRKSSFFPYLGAGMAFGLGRNCEDVSNCAVAPTLDYGIQYMYRFSRSFSMYLDFHGNGVGKQLENEVCEQHLLHASYGLKIGAMFYL